MYNYTIFLFFYFFNFRQEELIILTEITPAVPQSATAAASAREVTAYLSSTLSHYTKKKK